MKTRSKKENKISRRGVLPFLGSSLLIPFLGFGQLENKNLEQPDDGETYQTLLKSDGTTVKVKVSTLKKSKIIKKNISNKSFLNWLDRKV